MNEQKAKERRALVWEVRARRARYLRSHYLEIETRIIPCCASCENNKARRCAAVPPPGAVISHRYGHVITDPDDLCLLWGASYEAFCKAFSFAHGRAALRRSGEYKNMSEEKNAPAASYGP